MADLLPAGATPLTVDFNHVANTTETSGTQNTVSSGKVGIILGITLVQVSTSATPKSRAVILINGQEAGLALEADAASPDFSSNAGDSNRYTRKTFFYALSQQPVLPPGSTINVKIKNSSVTGLVTTHARVNAYEYTP